MIVLEQAAEPLATLARSSARVHSAIDKFIADALMVPLVIEMNLVLINSAADSGPRVHSSGVTVQSVLAGAR